MICLKFSFTILITEYQQPIPKLQMRIFTIFFHQLEQLLQLLQLLQPLHFLLLSETILFDLQTKFEEHQRFAVQELVVGSDEQDNCIKIMHLAQRIQHPISKLNKNPNFHDSQFRNWLLVPVNKIIYLNCIVQLFGGFCSSIFHIFGK